MIVVDNIKKSFGKVLAVDHASFKADNGSITTLLGANGSGKTTTFRAITGLLHPQEGKVIIDGVHVEDDPVTAQKSLGVFPDKFGLYERLTTREHLIYFAELHGLSGTRLEVAIDEVVELLHMQDILDRRTKGFSQGQRMKVALSRSLMHKPKNFVLDEPTRGLDVTSVRMVRDLLLDLKAKGHCILMSSHVMAEVEILSDHIVMMAEGRIVAEGTSKALVDHSGEKTLEDAFVALTTIDEGESL